MIFLKASQELKSAFGYLVKSMGKNVTWNEVFVVTYNKIILPGKVRSTFFDFDTRRINTNLIDLEIKEDQVYETAGNDMLANVLNMTIYAFGKWGAIKGLNVEKNYGQLNTLFQVILKEVKISPSFREDHFQFWKEDRQLTYEDVIQEILEQGEENEEKKEEKEGEEAENKETENGSKEPDSGGTKKNAGSTEDEEYKLGLWRKIRWATQPFSFVKGTQETEDKKKARLGNDFYMVDYLCPLCGQKLYIVLYPVNGEFLIETEEGGVYLSRAYACGSCSRFFTPRPGKLLKEGDVYTLDFEEDRKAFEDYLELLGAKGTRQANYKFNEYASQRKKGDDAAESLSEALEGMDLMSREELGRIQEKMEDQFYPERETKKYQGLVKNRLRELETKLAEQTGKPGGSSGDGTGRSDEKDTRVKGHGKTERTEKAKLPLTSGASGKEKREGRLQPQGAAGRTGGGNLNLQQDFTARTADELRGILRELQKQAGGENKNGEETAERKEALNRAREALRAKLTAKYDARLKILDKMQPPALKSLKNSILSETVFSEAEKKEYQDAIDQALMKMAGSSLQKSLENAKGKNYRELSRMIGAVQGEDVPEAAKIPALSILSGLKAEQGKRELTQMFSRLPPINSRKQLEQLYLKVKEYSDIDVEPYIRQLDEKQDAAEKKEISDLVRRSDTKDRKALNNLYERLKEQGFKKENITPFLNKIHDKIYELDEKALREICPDVMAVNFDEGAAAYEKIASGVFLPELKIDMLKMLDKRLTMLKTGESGQLVRKLKKEMDENVKDTSRLHYYDARRMLKSEAAEAGDLVIQKALSSYVPERNAYEYPILIADSTRSGNGKEGFVLTPDHIFYGSLLNTGAVRVFDVEDVVVKGGVIGKGMYLKMDSGDKVKLPGVAPQKEWDAFAGVLRDFIAYLKEKPESRNISYLMKDKHEEKCCYRCGFVFTGGDICPKCGSKANR